MRLGILAIAGAIASTGFAGIIWQQDFSSSSNIVDYIGAGPNQFRSIGSVGPVAIDNGALLLSIPAGSGSAGFLTAPAGTGGTLMFEADVTWTRDANSVFGPYGGIHFGKFDVATSDYLTYAHTSRVFQTVDFRRNGGNMSISGTTFAWDVTRHLMVYMNDTDDATTYEVGGVIYGLSANSYSLWVDDTLLRDNVAANDYYHTNGSVADPVLNTILFQANANPTQANEIRIDNMVLWDSFVVPEPASLALLSLAGLGMMRRRHEA